MLAEEFIAQINANVFLREFSFAKNKFKLPSNDEVEFADHVIWIDDLLFIIQLKEREKKEDNLEGINKWLSRKVLGKATRQIRDSLDYLENLSVVEIQNQRGNKFFLNAKSLSVIIKIVIYKAGNDNIENVLKPKKHFSQTAGFIHVVSLDDYLRICRTLITPEEIKRYFIFREKLLSKQEHKSESFSEISFIGQFLYGEFESPPDENYSKYYVSFLNVVGEFDISSFLNEMPNRIDLDKSKEYGGPDYYGILIEFAKLTRIEWKAIKERILLCLDIVKEKKIELPYRIGAPLTGCGFVFVPIPEQLIQNKVIVLKNMMFAAKYDQKLEKCIGLSFSYENGYFLIDWGYLVSPWERDEEMESFLKENNRFRSLKQEEVPPYFFDRGK